MDLACLMTTNREINTDLNNEYIRAVFKKEKSREVYKMSRSIRVTIDRVMPRFTIDLLRQKRYRCVASGDPELLTKLIAWQALHKSVFESDRNKQVAMFLLDRGMAPTIDCLSTALSYMKPWCIWQLTRPELGLDIDLTSLELRRQFAAAFPKYRYLDRNLQMQ